MLDLPRIIYVPAHGLFEALADTMSRRIVKQPASFADVGLGMAHVTVPVFAVIRAAISYPRKIVRQQRALQLE